MALRLPSHLYETYASYKKGTIDVIQWLHNNSGSSGGQSFDLYSIRQIQDLTDAAIAKGTPVSSTILETLRKTINARKKIGEYFKVSDNPATKEANACHDAFTTMLLAVYKSLCALRDDIKPQVNACRPTNMFEYLDCDSPDELDLPEQPRSIVESSLRTSPGKVDSRLNKGQDTISEIMALSMYFLQLEELYSTTQDSWMKVESGDMPVTLASLTCTLAYQATQTLQPQLDELGIRNPDELYLRYNLCARSLSSKKTPSHDAILRSFENTPFSKAKQLRESWHALQSFKQKWMSKPTALYNLVPSTCCTIRPHCAACDGLAILFPGGVTELEPGPTLDRNFRRYLDQMLNTICHLFDPSKQPRTSLLPFQIPFLDDLRSFLESDEYCYDSSDITGCLQSSPLNLSFGLLILMDSYDGYPSLPMQSLLPKKECALEDQRTECLPPRLACMKFTCHLAESIDCFFRDSNSPCSCFEINGTKVLDVIYLYRRLLQDFLIFDNMDFFHLAPWIAGTHMLKNLTTASDYGLMAWHHNYYVGTILHLYNSMIALGALKPDQVPLMEALCAMFEDSVFLGTRPQRNFSSCFKIWMGSRLTLNRKGCRSMHSAYHHKTALGKKWAMEHVYDNSQGGNDDKRSFKPAKVSLLSLIVANKSATTDEILVRIYPPQKSGKANASDIKKARKAMTADPFVAHHISHVQANLLAEFRGPLPVAKVNYFELFEICCEMYRYISFDDHDCDAKWEDPCACIAERLLATADKYENDARIAKPYKDDDLVKICVNAFVKFVGGSELSDYTWDI